MAQQFGGLLGTKSIGGYSFGKFSATDRNVGGGGQAAELLENRLLRSLVSFVDAGELLQESLDFGRAEPTPRDQLAALPRAEPRR